MRQQRHGDAAPESMFEFDYEGRSYRFVKPDIWQHSFYCIHRTGFFYEQEMLKDMRKHLRGRELAIDVGANIGNHTVFLAGVCRCEVVAFEPYPKTFSYLMENIKLNGLTDHVKALNIAVGEKPGYGQICLPANANYGEVAVKETSARTDIRVEPLDAIDFSRLPRLLKIDVEGGEVAVLRGARSLIERSRPLIYLETLDEDAFDTVSEFMCDVDYRVVDFFAPATFLFASVDEAAFGPQRVDPGNHLARLCLRYNIELKQANLRMRRLKDTWWRRFKKRIKGKPLKDADD